MPNRGTDGFTLPPGTVMDSVRAGQLGSLFGCPHLRVAVRRREAMFRDEVVCSVCGELRGWLNDEETYRNLGAMVRYA